MLSLLAQKLDKQETHTFWRGHPFYFGYLYTPQRTLGSMAGLPVFDPMDASVRWQGRKLGAGMIGKRS